MSKVRRNSLCPCGSGKKYKRCCLSIERQNAVLIPVLDDEEAAELEYLTNGVVDLVSEGCFDEAERMCNELEQKYPEFIDRYERRGLLHEARGESQKAIDFYRRCVDYIEENPVGFDQASKDWYLGEIERLTT